MYPLTLERGVVVLTRAIHPAGEICIDCREVIPCGELRARTGTELKTQRCSTCAGAYLETLPVCPTCEVKVEPADPSTIIRNDVAYCSDRCLLTVRDRDVAELRSVLERHGGTTAAPTIVIPRRRIRRGRR